MCKIIPAYKLEELKQVAKELPYEMVWLEHKGGCSHKISLHGYSVDFVVDEDDPVFIDWLDMVSRIDREVLLALIKSYESKIQNI